MGVRTVKKILIVRIDFLGDMICTTPLFDEIKKVAKCGNSCIS